METEFAPGIKDKNVSHELPTINERRTFEFTVHDHNAEKRGRHFDLRLGDPKTGYAHSWAMHASWPSPGEKTWAIKQPTHSMKYMDFKGKIEDGYGKGDVDIFDRCKTEVMNSRPGHISFNIYRGTGPEEYSLHRVGDKQWILMNRTMQRDKHQDLPEDKPTYKETKLTDPRIYGDDYALSAKIDDAHNLIYLPASGEKIRILSYRPSKRTSGGIIEHTHKVPGILEGVPTPPLLGGTILRGGLYSIHPKTGKATQAKDLAGVINSDVWKSREKQKEFGALTPVLYDVVQFRGRNMEDAPYSEKLEVLKKVEAALPDYFHLPRMAFTKQDKEKMIADMRAGNLPETTEGVVAWNLRKGTAPYKAKFSSDYDVHIRDFYPGEGQHKGSGVGGFFYSHTPEGPIVGKVGTGFSHAQRRDMHKHPENYLGTVARVKAQEVYSSGALRGPSFQDFHMDKNTPEQLGRIKHASACFALDFLWGW